MLQRPWFFNMGINEVGGQLQSLRAQAPAIVDFHLLYSGPGVP